MAVTERDLEEVRNKMLGVPGGGADVSAMKDELRAKLKEIEELNRRIDMARRTERGASLSSACEALREDCPYMYLSTVSPRGSGSTSVMYGANQGFEIYVRRAPFHMFNEATGIALHTTLPLNYITMRVASSGVVAIDISAKLWRTAWEDFGDADGEPNARYDGIVTADQMFGHPHCSERVSMQADGSVDAGAMCMGNNPASHMLRRLDSQGQLLMALRALYSWLTEVNVHSVFSTPASPVVVDSGYAGSVLRPACERVKPKLLELANSPTYHKFVNSIRSPGDPIDSALFVAKVMSELDSPDFEPVWNTSIGDQLHAVSDMFRPGSPASHACSALALHQLVGCMLLTSDERQGQYMLPEESALVGCVMLGKAWKMALESTHFTHALTKEGALLRKEAARYVGDWEVMKNGY